MTARAVLGQLAVFGLLVVCVIGSALVFSSKGGRSQIMPLVDGAYPGGIIALCGATALLITAILLGSRDALGMQVVVSGLLVVLNLFSIYVTQGRIDSGEITNESVGWGMVAYLVAAAVQAIAATVGILRIRRMRSD